MFSSLQYLFLGVGLGLYFLVIVYNLSHTIVQHQTSYSVGKPGVGLAIILFYLIVGISLGGIIAFSLMLAKEKLSMQVTATLISAYTLLGLIYGVGFVLFKRLKKA